MSAPTVTQVAADLVHGVRSYLRYTPSGESPTPIEVLTTLVSYEGANETIKNLVPGTDNILRPNRESQKSSEEAFIIDMRELKLVLSLLGGLNKLRKGGTAQLWIYDPDDVAGKVKIKTNAFACSLKREGGSIDFGADDFAMTKVRITNLSGADVVLTIDGDAANA